MYTITQELTNKISLPLNHAKEFFFAGNALFTIESKGTGKHYTYKVNKHKTNNIYFVSVLSIDAELCYLGVIKPEQNIFHTTQKSIFNKDNLCYRVFDWVYKVLLYENQDKFQQMEFMHHGICCKCGRTLTTPDSIKKGIGPICENN